MRPDAATNDRTDAMNKERVLILCTGNSARSQMAEGLLRHDRGHRFDVESGGTKPSQLRAEAVAVMREVGIDISAHRAKSVAEFEGKHFDYLLTVCDDAKEICLLYVGATRQIHQNFEDPAALQGVEEERLAIFRKVRDEIRGYLKDFPHKDDVMKLVETDVSLPQ